MTVGELVERLKEFPQELEVETDGDWAYFPVSSVDKEQVGKRTVVIIS